MERGTPLSIGSLSGRRYFEPLPEIEAALPAWFETSTVADAQVIKKRRVFRRGPLVFKFSGPGQGFKDAFRASYAMRAARAHFRILPVRSPVPYLAVDERRGGRLVNSLLVSEFIEGEFLTEAWEDPASLEALPVFLADMHRAGIMHGDLHAANFIWSGTEWVLLELEGLRNRLQRLLHTKFLTLTWSALLRSTPTVPVPVMREMYERYAEHTGWKFDLDAVWKQAQIDAAHVIANRPLDAFTRDR